MIKNSIPRRTRITNTKFLTSISWFFSLKRREKGLYSGIIARMNIMRLTYRNDYDYNANSKVYDQEENATKC
ncbi:hypothetical protein PUR_35420 [Paenibacillus sp. URB8-2]|nr:hypothetical protein PUR_35420 [Paenibacillus sp. URB8-2]